MKNGILMILLTALVIGLSLLCANCILKLISAKDDLKVVFGVVGAVVLVLVDCEFYKIISKQIKN